MPQIEICRFENGSLNEAQAPQWFTQAIETDQDWTDEFRDHGVVLVDEFDCGDSIEIYRAEDYSYCIVFRDVNQANLVVFIQKQSDYYRFRAEFIAGNVELMMRSEQLEERDQARRLRRAS